jgi:plasmid replication initiation protein
MSNSVLTLDVRQRHNEAIKPAELIQVKGHHELSLTARRAITALWHNAKEQGIEAGKDYTIEIDRLNTDTHKGYELVEDAIEKLMKTILTVKRPNGDTTRVQFLGGNDMMDKDRAGGVLTYSFDKRLIDILKESKVWGKISMELIFALSSKYAISLYENIQQFTGLSHKTITEFSLEEFRDLLGVPPHKYKDFGSLNKYVIKPAVEEINALAPFNINLLPIKQGKKVVSITVGWYSKTDSELKAAWREIQRPKTGRRARIKGTAEDLVFEPVPSKARLQRRGASTFE